MVQVISITVNFSNEVVPQFVIIQIISSMYGDLVTVYAKVGNCIPYEESLES